MRAGRLKYEAWSFTFTPSILLHGVAISVGVALTFAKMSRSNRILTEITKQNLLLRMMF